MIRVVTVSFGEVEKLLILPELLVFSFPIPLIQNQLTELKMEHQSAIFDNN